MKYTPIHTKFIFRFCSWLFFFVAISGIAFSQKRFSGRILSNTEGKAIPFATIGIKGKRAGGITDTSGRFGIIIPDQVKETDTLIISSIGFEIIKMPLKEAFSQSEFRLTEKVSSLPELVMYSFRKRSSIGSYTIYSIYRAWYEYKTGGEIGSVFRFPHKKFKIDRILFKTDNKCDTCLVRLHIRKMLNGKPADELLKKNIILPVYASSFEDAAPEFILDDEDVVLSETEIFIGLEVLACTCETEKNFSISFGGTESGEFYYKSFAYSPWEKETSYGLYMRITLKY